MKIKTDYAKNLNFQIFSVKNKVRVSVITSNKYDWTSVKYLNVLHHNDIKTINRKQDHDKSFLVHFSPMFHFYIPLKGSYFLTFSEVIEMELWAKMV